MPKYRVWAKSVAYVDLIAEVKVEAATASEATDKVMDMWKSSGSER
jgi:hypothetical protein